MASHRKKRRLVANEIIGIVLIAIAILSGLGIYMESSGIWGDLFRKVSFGSFGVVAYISPVFILVFGLYLLLYGDEKKTKGKSVCYLVIFLCVLAGIHLAYTNQLLGADFSVHINNSYEYGVLFRRSAGAIGAVLSYPLQKLFGVAGAYVSLVAITAVCLLIVTNLSMHSVRKNTEKKIKEVRETIHEKHDQRMESAQIKSAKREKHEAPSNGGLRVFTIDDKKHRRTDDASDLSFMPGLKHASDMSGKKTAKTANIKNESIEDEKAYVSEYETAEAVEPVQPTRKNKISREELDKAVAETEREAQAAAVAPEYRIPPLSMLTKSSAVTAREQRQIQVDTNAKAALLERTFEEFRISAQVVDVTIGPSITRYVVQPAAGVSVRRITNLEDDIALSMAASGVFIEAPIPGRSAVGIDIPNRERRSIMLRDVLESDAFQNHKSKISVVLGKEIDGKDIVIDLGEMPHLLVAGTTGSGKSVCINSMIVSILFHALPSEVQLILIDPKMVEFGMYHDIPHLKVPVVTDKKKAAGALQWACVEMERRYQALSEKGARDIKRYNDMMKMVGEEPLPYIVIFVDELSDLMMTAPREVEEALCRIAQMGRAAGIHLVVATQRPSVDVITGLIKANFPSRIALTVFNQFDSRTIIDQSGAEKLTGRGDMLFKWPGVPKPVRIQGTYVSDPEVEALADFIRGSGVQPVYDQNVLNRIEKGVETKNDKMAAAKAESTAEEEGDLLNAAIEIFLDAGQGSTSLLQRKLRIGYGRAARLLDQMEDLGIIGPNEGPRPRKVLISKSEYYMSKNEGDAE